MVQLQNRWWNMHCDVTLQTQVFWYLWVSIICLSHMVRIAKNSLFCISGVGVGELTGLFLYIKAGCNAIPSLMQIFLPKYYPTVASYWAAWKIPGVTLWTLSFGLWVVSFSPLSHAPAYQSFSLLKALCLFLLLITANRSWQAVIPNLILSRWTEYNLPLLAFVLLLRNNGVFTPTWGQASFSSSQQPCEVGQRERNCFKHPWCRQGTPRQTTETLIQMDSYIACLLACIPLLH